jgi:O-antigen/teichoic acid export membrane protein
LIIEYINRKSWRSNFSWTLSANLVYAISQWGILICIVRLCDVETVGIYAYILALVSPFYLMFSMQLRGILATDSKEQFELGHYLLLRISTSLIILLIIVSMSILRIFSGEISILLIIITCSKGIESVSDLLFGLFQQKERMDYVGKSILMKGVSSFLALATVLVLTKSLVLSLLTILLIWLCLLIFYDFKNTAKLVHIKFQINWKIIGKITLTAFPLGVVMGLISLNESIPKYVIEHNVGQLLLGYFATIAYFKIAGGTVVNALGQSSISRLARYYADFEYIKFLKSILTMILSVVILSIIGLVIVFMFGDLILELVYTIDYRPFHTLFLYLMIAAVIEYLGSILGYSMTAAKHYRIQPYLYLTVIIVNLVLCVYRYS